MKTGQQLIKLLKTNKDLFSFKFFKKRSKKMKITEFNKIVCEREGGQKELTIAQVSEVIKITNDLTNGILYKTIELIPDQN